MAKKRNRGINPGIPLTEHDKGLFESAKVSGSKAVCFFNNKGGVGKTTLVANLSAELSINFKAKVLVVDADPQCNLTQYILAEDEALEIYSRNNIDSIYSVIRPLSFGKGYGKDLPLRHFENFGFDLIIGDPRLALQEDLLAQDWRDTRGGGMRGIQTTFVFANLVADAKKLDYDFIFFDMGPSLGAINRSILLAMDFFVVPMSIDVFSTWAIRNIGTTVAIWQKTLENGIRLAEDPDEIRDLDYRAKLKFLGYVTQQHRERVEEERQTIIEDQGQEDQGQEDQGQEGQERRKRLVQAYEDIAAKFPEEVHASLGKFVGSPRVDPFLGNVRHLGSLAPKSQSQHVPMISVRGTGRFIQSRKQAREIYRSIAQRYLENIVTSSWP